MPDQPLDEVDYAILFELQRDARITKTEIAERIGVSSSTVGKRMTHLKDKKIIKGYYPEIDYDRIDHTLHVLFSCTTAIPERESLIQEVLDIDAVVTVRELMTGERNVQIQVVGQPNAITRAAHKIDELGFTVNDEILIRAEHTRPAGIFDSSNPTPASLDGEG